MISIGERSGLEGAESILSCVALRVKNHNIRKSVKRSFCRDESGLLNILERVQLDVRQ